MNSFNLVKFSLSVKKWKQNKDRLINFIGNIEKEYDVNMMIRTKEYNGNTVRVIIKITPASVGATEDLRKGIGDCLKKDVVVYASTYKNGKEISNGEVDSLYEPEGYAVKLIKVDKIPISEDTTGYEKLHIYNPKFVLTYDKKQQLFPDDFLICNNFLYIKKEKKDLMNKAVYFDFSDLRRIEKFFVK